MGVNVFVPIMPDDNVDLIVEAANAQAEETGAFEWCGLFKGEGGHTLMLIQALQFSEEEKPWFVLYPTSPLHSYALTKTNLLDGELFWCTNDAQYPNTQTGPAYWKQLLTESNCSHVLFLKARL